MMEQALEQKVSYDEKHVALECLEVLDPDVRSLVEAHHRGSKPPANRDQSTAIGEL